MRRPLRSRPDPAEEERLLKLFWNRAELKKELAGLDEELYQLKDRLKQQVAANDRAQEQVEQLIQHQRIIHQKRTSTPAKK